MVTLEDVKKNPEVIELIVGAQRQLEALGFTEHSLRHVGIVAERAGKILKMLGYPEDRIELAKIAGYLHDIGNTINRADHAHSGALLAYSILKGMGMNASDKADIVMAIGNHDEETGRPVNEISAALILADKSEVHRDRVMTKEEHLFDIHDRVNYAVTDAELIISKEEKKVTLNLKIDTEMCPILDYFKIFMDRTMMS
ncbi:MAG: HD domain-containing protein, partial [Oscillospiraceae bacterium]|nr:HD domain-containing protein [Oscillospiraceae bacterium]